MLTGLVTLVACLVSVAPSHASVVAPWVPISNAAVVSPEPVVELAADTRSQALGRPEPPPRGSSAQLDGGSSADRYGGTSADRGGIAGPRDIRNRGVRQKGFKTGPESRGDGGKRGNQNGDEERDQDDEEE